MRGAAAGPNAGAWIQQFGLYRMAHGRAHPVQEVSQQEAATRIANAQAADTRSKNAVARAKRANSKRAAAAAGGGAAVSPAPPAQ